MRLARAGVLAGSLPACAPVSAQYPVAAMLFCHSLPSPAWESSPNFRTSAGVAVFRVAIAENSRYVPQATVVLTAAEQQRAQRYYRPQDAQRFLLGRAALRLLLAAYTQQPPASLRFEPGPTKKPVLCEMPGLHYNVSHSGNWVLIVIAAAEVGIDVEKIETQFAFEELLAASFSPAERTFIGQDATSRPRFYQLWTRKEAFVKATAQGIDEHFSSVPSLDGYHQAGSPEVGWAVSSFAVAAGYAAAVAYPQALRKHVRFYDPGTALFDVL